MNKVIISTVHLEQCHLFFVCGKAVQNRQLTVCRETIHPSYESHYNGAVISNQDFSRSGGGQYSSSLKNLDKFIRIQGVPAYCLHTLKDYYL